jgi:hypothetical protein
MPETPRHTLKWGLWTYDPATVTIEHDKEYQVDLERCRTSAETLDWIFQLHNRTWTRPEDVGYLVMAMHALLRPQATLCSMGHDKRIDDVKAVIRSNGFEA